MSTRRKTLFVAAALGLLGLFVQTDAQAQTRGYGYNGSSPRHTLMPNLVARGSTSQQDVRRGRVLITVLHDASGSKGPRQAYR
jgi:hypothetical protein